MSPYFNQSEEWKQFFLQANNDNHSVIDVEFEGVTTIVYEYPLVKGFKFWYVPRLYFELDNESVEGYEIVLKGLVNNIRNMAKASRVVHISFDFDERLLNRFSGNEYSIAGLKRVTGINLWKPIKKLQYLSTPTLPVDKLVGDSKGTVQEFFKENEKGFFSRTNKTCRNLTRRSLEKGWECDFAKIDQDFEDFWAIWESTANRQGFNLHPKNYIKSLLTNEFAKLIVIRNQQNKVQGGWVLVYINNSVINLYGANSQESLDNGGQYYFHTFALKYIKSLIEEGKYVEFYDLGGSDEEGYGNFKKSYKPDYISFIGQFDHVLSPHIYLPLKLVKNVKELLKNSKIKLIQLLRSIKTFSN